MLLALLALAGCTPAPVMASAPVVTTTATPSAPPDEPATVISAAPAQSSVAPAVAPSRVETIPELAHFYAALRALENKSRKSHVRVYWMGDSHAQADFWSGALRDGLQTKFGNGGPGFLHLGYKNYRHDGIKTEIEGRWRMRPKKPAGIKTAGDGVVGLGGLLMGGYQDTPRAEISVTEAMPGTTVLYDFCYRLKTPTDTIDVTVDGKRVTLASSKSEPSGELRHASFRGSPPGDFAARPTNGTPDFCGVTIESDPVESPGVVLDTLGINGARYATALSWNEKSWLSEVSRRPPDLVVFEYGTNEAGDPSPGYGGTGKNMEAMIDRIRKVRPDVDCVVVSATDRADVEEHLPLMNASISAAAKKSGCFYFDAYGILGGKGAASRMREEVPPRAQKDGIHLTIRGYRELGKTMLDALSKGY